MSKPSIAISFLFLVLSASSTACTRGAVGRVAGGFIDCMTPEVKAAVTELQPAFLEVVKGSIASDGSVDKSPLRQAASSLRSNGTRCAFDAAIAELLHPKPADPNAPKSSPLEVDKAQLAASYEEIRADFWGGATPKSSP